MQITIQHPEFKTQLLEMNISGYFSTPRIMLNGVPVRLTGGVYSVINDAGNDVTVKLNTSIFNMLPQLLIEQQEIRISTETGWTQFAGWRKSSPVRWTTLAIQSLCKIVSIKKINKTVQG